MDVYFALCIIGAVLIVGSAVVVLCGHSCGLLLLAWHFLGKRYILHYKYSASYLAVPTFYTAIDECLDL